MSSESAQQNRLQISQRLEPPSLLQPRIVERNGGINIDINIHALNEIIVAFSAYLQEQSATIQARSADRDFEWFVSSPSELSQYKDKYVAIFNQQVIGWGDTVKQADDMAQQRIPGADPLIEFIDPNPDMILSLDNVDKTADKFSNNGDRPNSPVS
jgi:hypothetical protein